MALDENINYDGSHLIKLSGSDYEIADGQPDVTGWDVIDLQGQKIGEIDDLIFNPESRKVRYLVVDMEDNDLDLETERKVLVPIGIADLHTSDDNVVLPNVSVEQLSDLPPYDSENAILPDTETTIRNVFDGGAAGLAYGAENSYNKEDFYTHDHFDDAKFYGSRSTSADEVLPEEPFANESTGFTTPESPIIGNDGFMRDEAAGDDLDFNEDNRSKGI